MYTPDEIELANEIAERLNDPGSLAQFLRYAREVPHDMLRRLLGNACAVPAHRVVSSRAAIFVNSVNSYLRYGHGRAGR